MDFDGDKVFSSQNLHAELNEERKKNGLPEIPAINPKASGSSNTLCRYDKSWNNVVDFYKKLFKKK